MAKDKILIVDDEEDIVTTWKMRLEFQGFEVVTASDGHEGLAAMVRHLPDLVLLDIVMPRLNGLELCRILKKDPVTSQVPLILLTAKGQLKDKLTGIECGADDYITKDAEPEEIEARIRMVLRRFKDNLGANPLTRLPGNAVIENMVMEKIKSGRAFALCYADLDNFKAFNDQYGFKMGDEVIQHTARVFVQEAKRHSNGEDFVGHIGGDDFVIITRPGMVERLCRDIISRLDAEFRAYYSAEDRARGYIVTADRKGMKQRFPLLSISIAVITNENKIISGLGEISQAATEVKKYLKGLEGSNYAYDKRGGKSG